MNDVQLMNAVMKLNLFDRVAHDQIEKILAIAQRRVLAPGAVLCESNTIDDDLFVFVDGQLRLESADGAKLAEMTEVRVIGEMGVFTGQARTSKVVAEVESTVLALSRDDLQDLVHDNPDLGQLMLSNLCNLLYGRVHDANQKTEGLRARNEQLRTRLADLAPDDPLLQASDSD